MILINPTQNPVRIRHITYKVIKDGDELKLSEIQEVSYPHPEAPEDATISTLEDHHLMTVNENSDFYHSLLLLYHAQKSVSNTLAKS